MDLLEQWVESMQNKKKSPNTIKAYTNDLNTLFNWLKQFKNVETIDIDVIKSITTQDLEKYMGYLMNERNNSSATMIQNGQAIRNFYSFLRKTMNLITVEQQIIAKDLDLPPKQKRIASCLFEEEAQKLVDNINGSKKVRDTAIIMLFLNTGLRNQELVDINVGDIINGNLRVIGKGDKERMVSLNQETIDAIDEYLKIRPEIGIPALFINERKVRVKPDGIRDIVESAAENIGRDDVTPHTLRHSFASMMLEKGETLKMVQEALGHESIITTQGYTHISAKHMKNAVEKLNIKVNRN